MEKIINIDENLRLRLFDGEYDFAFDWYQDEELVYLVDGRKYKYDVETLSSMYNYLNECSRLYFIEIKEGDEFRPIGDVSFSLTDIPIVIGDCKYRGKGIGTRVIKYFIDESKRNGVKTLENNPYMTLMKDQKDVLKNLDLKKMKKLTEGIVTDWSCNVLFFISKKWREK